MGTEFEKTVFIHSSADIVWQYLTDPGLMKKWMGEPELKIKVDTNWIPGSSILITGYHHGNFVNKGLVLQAERNKVLQYTHLSSVSRLPDSIENYSVLTFTLKPEGQRTTLSLNIKNFPTETIYKHFELYWRTTLEILKSDIEIANFGK
jgi:uncharacterized protein YndB with AHSA1/START domain